MTRSYKANDTDHSAGTTNTQEKQASRYYTKHGFVDTDPAKVKKDGAGRGNWGREGEEVTDAGYTFTKQRRHSNSAHQHLEEFRTKFEDVEPEPEMEFEEEESSTASSTSH